MQTDVLIIGGGLAGICAADQVTQSSRLQVDLLQDGSGASPFIHGFCLPFGPGDSPSLLEQDTLAAGHGIADPRLVHTLCTEASSLPAYFQELVSTWTAARRGSGGCSLWAPRCRGSSR